MFCAPVPDTIQFLIVQCLPNISKFSSGIGSLLNHVFFCACNVKNGQFLNSRLLDGCMCSCVSKCNLICMNVCIFVYGCVMHAHTPESVSKDNVFGF